MPLRSRRSTRRDDRRRWPRRADEAGARCRRNPPAPRGSGYETRSPRAGSPATADRPAGGYVGARVRLRGPGAAPPTAAPGIGMARRIEQLIRGRLLHELAEIHHTHVVADLAHHRQIVGDEQHRDVGFALELHEQLDDACLDGDIERGNRLVADQHFRLDDQRPGDTDALALAAGEFVRVAIQMRLATGRHDRASSGHALAPLGA